MIDGPLREHFDAGISIVAGSVSTAGVPHASRCYGITVLADDLAQVYLDADDAVLLDNVRGWPRLAITTGDVFTFQSVQLKGDIESLDPASAAEAAVAADLFGRFVEKVNVLDQVPAESLLETLPVAFLTCKLRVRRLFDQTPGPNAGTDLRTVS